MLLNDPTYVEAARVFAMRVLREGQGSLESRVNRAWQLALQRDPHPDEVKAVRDLLATHLKIYRANPEAAQALLRTGLSPQPADLDPVEVAAWAHVARVLLNLHETITRS